MAMLEAVYISDHNNCLVYEYQVSLRLPDFDQVKTLITNHDDDGMPVVAINQDFRMVYEKFASITIYVLCSQSEFSKTNPMIPFVFIHRLFAVIREYFGLPVSPTKIEANADTLTTLMAEMLDTSGRPYITDANKLRDIIPHQLFLLKLLSSSLAAVLGEALAMRPPLALLSSLDVTRKSLDVPWRRSNVRYTNNEMYVDVVEEIRILYQVAATADSVRAKLVPLESTIDGHISFLSHLTGVPTLGLLFNHVASKVNGPSFHPCIDKEKWERKAQLEFIPPDGNLRLMSYQLDNNHDNRGLVELDYLPQLATGEFELKLIIRALPTVSKIDNITVEICCNEEITLKSLRCTHGDFSYKGNGVGLWTMRDVKPGAQPFLQALVYNHETNERGTPSYININYGHKGSVPSGLKVDSLRIINAKGMPELVKPYKGVKYITRTGNMVIRP